MKPPRVRDFDPCEKARHEFELTGLCFGMHLLELLWPRRSEKNLLDSRSIAGSVGRPIRLAGVLDALRLADTHKGETMEFVTLEDEFGVFEVTLFPQVYRRFASVARTHGPYVVEGRVEDQYGAVTLTASMIERRDPATRVRPADVARTGKSWAIDCGPRAAAMREAVE